MCCLYCNLCIMFSIIRCKSCGQWKLYAATDWHWTVCHISVAWLLL